MSSIDSIKKFNQEAQNKKLRFFAKVDITTKLKILEQQKKIFHQLKNVHKDVDNVSLTYSSLILAIDNFESKLDSVNLNAIKLRSKKQRSKIKKEKFLSYFSIVKTLRNNEKMSFRDISVYLKKYHKFEVSYSFIYQIWNEIENRNTEKKEK
ncbi:hypothetical protein ACH5BF_07740 [Arcobacter sp. YIC-464]|uniref:hypothetical protein n=1 Tax=Arcobacter sp. YIC-464 TaxID=3376631 RepID=UPI003C1985A7